MATSYTPAGWTTGTDTAYLRGPHIGTSGYYGRKASEKTLYIAAYANYGTITDKEWLAPIRLSGAGAVVTAVA